MCSSHCVQLSGCISPHLYGSHLALLQSHTVSSTAGTVIPSFWVLQVWVGMVPKALRCGREAGVVGMAENTVSLDKLAVSWCDYTSSYTAMSSSQSGVGSTRLDEATTFEVHANSLVWCTVVCFSHYQFPWCLYWCGPFLPRPMQLAYNTNQWVQYSL